MRVTKSLYGKGEIIMNECLHCKKKIIFKRKWQKYCSSKCRWESWNKRNPRIKIKT